jgi:mannose-1-phosphate guanylyltransferase/mannose-6-phosphate isomerase
MEKPQSLHVEKPWGSFDRYTLNAACTVKVITCRPGEKLSRQKHSHRDELWVVLDDGAEVELDGKILSPLKGQELWLPCGCIHRLSCHVSYKRPVRVLEISFGDFDEDDIERLEDGYGRV